MAPHSWLSSSRGCFTFDSINIAINPPREPSTSIHSITISNSFTMEWQQQNIGIGSWVIMAPPCWSQKSTSTSKLFRTSFKARILDFKVIVGQKIVKEALVQHAFTYAEVVANGGDVSAIQSPSCNCK